MTFTAEMLRTSPAEPGYDVEQLAACIDACLACSQSCTACADACLGEDMVAELRNCITTDLNCAEICDITARVLSRQCGYTAEVSHALLQACATVCRQCSVECERQAEMHQHCKVCADACRQCAQACDRLLASS